MNNITKSSLIIISLNLLSKKTYYFGFYIIIWIYKRKLIIISYQQIKKLEINILKLKLK